MYKEHLWSSEPPSEETHDGTNPYPHDMNTMEGSEFLDDALRMKEQPLVLRKVQVTNDDTSQSSGWLPMR